MNDNVVRLVLSIFKPDEFIERSIARSWFVIVSSLEPIFHVRRIF